MVHKKVVERKIVGRHVGWLIPACTRNAPFIGTRAGELVEIR